MRAYQLLQVFSSRHNMLVASAALLLFFSAANVAHAGFRFVGNDGASGMTSAAAPSSPVVEGFADRVPLPVALRQILPRGTIYNIANDVDMGVQISWKGGRPWQQVLNESLAAVGLQATITSSAVNVRRAAYLNGNTMGTSEPIQLMPPVRLTPPIKPVTIEEPLLAPPSSVKSMALPVPVQDEAPTTVANTVATMTTEGSAVAVPQGDSAKVLEITSNDPDIRAEVSGGASSGVTMGSPAGYLTLPAGAENAVADVGTGMNAGVSTLTPLDGSAPMLDQAAGVNPNLWEARAGQTMREVLTGWSERSGVEVNWQSEYDYPVQASLSYSGTFEEAVRTLLFGFKDAVPQPIGRLHKNEQIGQQALLITTRGNIYEE